MCTARMPTALLSCRKAIAGEQRVNLIRLLPVTSPMLSKQCACHAHGNKAMYPANRSQIETYRKMNFRNDYQLLGSSGLPERSDGAFCSQLLEIEGVHLIYSIGMTLVTSSLLCMMAVTTGCRRLR